MFFGPFPRLPCYKREPLWKVEYLPTEQETKPVSDPVNHPPHYTAGKIEVIDFIEQIVKLYPPEIGYHVGNTLKYLSRAPLKANLRQDLGKAGWYLDRAMSALPDPSTSK